MRRKMLFGNRHSHAIGKTLPERTCGDFDAAGEVPLGVTYRSDYAHDLTGIPLGEKLYPVQLFEAALNFLNFAILFLILRRKRFDGQVFAFYILNYSVIRFFTEYFRGDHSGPTYLIQGASPWSSLSYPQFFSLVGIAAALLLMMFMGKRSAGAAGQDRTAS